MQKVTFKAEQDILQGTLFYPHEKKNKYPAVLFIHGWTSSEKGYAEYSEAFNKIGVACLTFDLRGHGKSYGDIKIQSRLDFLEDAIAAYDFLVQSNRIDKNNVTVVGSSFGSYLAVLLTKHRKVNRLILRVPANYPNGDFNEPQSKYSDKVEILRWRYEVKNPEETHALKALHNFEGEVLVVESENDEIIPHQTINNYLQAVKNKADLKHVVIKNAPHGLSSPELREEYLNIMLLWLKPKLPSEES